MMVGTWAALPGTTGTWSYMYWGVLATTTPDPIVPGNTRLEPNGEAPCRATIVPGGQNRQGSDRKSTRLNSSHTVISYAVFCLKKKKKKEQIGTCTPETKHSNQLLVYNLSPQEPKYINSM